MPEEIDNIFSSLKKSVKNSREKPYNKDEHRDKTRSWLARWFVLGYFGIILLLIFCIPIYNIFVVNINKILVLDFQNTFLAITSSIVGLLGFVLGFYFKEGEK